LPTPSIRLLWSSQEFMVGQSRAFTTPFTVLAGAAGYFVSRIGSSMTTTTSGTTTTTNTTNGAVAPMTSTAKTTSEGGSGLPLGAAVAASSLSGAQTLNVPGTNPTHILKSTAADFATTVHNHIRDVCENDPDSDLKTFCDETFSFDGDPVKGRPSR
jgi:hypothetical protein